MPTAAIPHGGVISADEPIETRPVTGFWALTLGSIGVVYGDIGTSPLYAVRESVVAAVGAGNPAGEAVVFGILSLIIWALILVVTLKYVVILLRADNSGEGGTLALMALAQRALGKRAGAIVLCGIISAALFYGDAMITPALSVLSAIEGVKVAMPNAQTVEIECKDVKPAILQLVSILHEEEVEMTSLETEEPNLEHVFLHLTGRALRD